MRVTYDTADRVRPGQRIYTGGLTLHVTARLAEADYDRPKITFLVREVFGRLPGEWPAYLWPGEVVEIHEPTAARPADTTRSTR